MKQPIRPAKWPRGVFTIHCWCVPYTPDLHFIHILCGLGMDIMVMCSTVVQRAQHRHTQMSMLSSAQLNCPPDVSSIDGLLRPKLLMKSARHAYLTDQIANHRPIERQWRKWNRQAEKTSTSCSVNQASNKKDLRQISRPPSSSIPRSLQRRAKPTVRRRAPSRRSQHPQGIFRRQKDCCFEGEDW